MFLQKRLIFYSMIRTSKRWFICLTSRMDNRLGEKQVSATKGEYKRRSHELGKEIAELKLGAMDLEAEFEKRCISVSDTYKHNYHTQVHQRLNFP